MSNNKAAKALEYFTYYLYYINNYELTFLFVYIPADDKKNLKLFVIIYYIEMCITTHIFSMGLDQGS